MKVKIKRYMFRLRAPHSVLKGGNETKGRQESIWRLGWEKRVHLDSIPYYFPSSFLPPPRWHGVATWRWDVNDERCGICYTAFEACCPDCHIPGDDCPPVWGRCNHAFHMHCIMKVSDANEEGNFCARRVLDD